jgi:AAA+ ATPase superfamily predicted ATPase
MSLVIQKLNILEELSEENDLRFNAETCHVSEIGSDRDRFFYGLL